MGQQPGKIWNMQRCWSVACSVDVGVIENVGKGDGGWRPFV